jgi:hypothetical protein
MKINAIMIAQVKSLSFVATNFFGEIELCGVLSSPDFQLQPSSQGEHRSPIVRPDERFTEEDVCDDLKYGMHDYPRGNDFRVCPYVLR